MHDDCVPLMLCGPLDRGVELAKRLGAPADIVRDRGHAAGMRMRDYGGFGDPQSDKTALLIETGQHWRASSVVVAKDVAASLPRRDRHGRGRRPAGRLEAAGAAQPARRRR